MGGRVVGCRWRREDVRGSRGDEAAEENVGETGEGTPSPAYDAM